MAWQSGRYGQALAASSRKLALLIGINRYPGEGSLLQGCLTDVELQRELLLHRFGFAPPEILTLTDGVATWSGIQSAFAEHLGGQSRTAETVVVHFSGHGQWLSGSQNPWQPALLLSGSEGSTGIPAIPLESFFHLLEGLGTAQLTTLLDCGFTHTAPSVRGNWQLRARPAAAVKGSGSPASDQSVDQSIGSVPAPQRVWPTPPKGLLITATTPQDLAAEASWPGFYAGVLTYLLTQYLWETTPATRLAVAFNQVSSRRELGMFACQRPTLEGKETARRIPPYFLNLAQSGVSGVIQDVKGSRAQVWLGGIPPAALCGLQPGTLLTPIPTDAPQEVANPPTPLVLRSRNGLLAQAQLSSSEGQLPPVGTPLREQLRGLSQTLKLLVGLEDNLGRIEKVDITNAIASFSWMETANPRERQVDCLLGRITPEMARAFQSDTLPKPLEVNSYSLFWPGRELVLDSCGPVGEAAAVAVQRLAPRLAHLLAAKRLRTTLNAASSPLAVVAELGSKDKSPSLAARFTQAVTSTPVELGMQRFMRGDPLRLTLRNNGEQDLFGYVLMTDPTGQLHLLAPMPQDNFTLPLRLEAQSTLVLPRLPETDNELRTTPGSSDLLTCNAQGLTELLFVASTRPLQTSLEALKSMARKLGVTRSPMLLNGPLEWTQMLMEELTSRASESFGSSDADLRLLDPAQSLTLSLTYTLI
ncbi:caspase family protein [Synechococcus sp. Nb3U1]|uniref:caspase family protein n=1 Tax=Synechococcus sp. Nb3U1 TaxID=1914529 RepID=UPI001F2F82E0|nr:caspase family protein [Synechococcus sp. Nb3U1]MCF2971771.1 caspase family protein [Synechococcus sp. Nb3U1]